MRAYRLTVPAEEDLIDIWNYSDSRWNEEQADRYIHQLHECFERIGNRLAATRALPDIHHDLASAPCQQHRIFFLDRETPAIIAIFHQRMNPFERLLRCLEKEV